MILKLLYELLLIKKLTYVIFLWFKQGIYNIKNLINISIIFNFKNNYSLEKEIKNEISIIKNILEYTEKLPKLEYISNFFDIWILPEFFVSIIIIYYIYIYIYKYQTKLFKIIRFFFLSSLLFKLCCYVLIILINILYILIKNNIFIFYFNFFSINIFTIIIKIIITFIFLYILYLVKFWYFQNQKYIIEIYFLLLGSLFFSFILISSTNLMLSYISIEGLSLQIYALSILNFSTVSIEIVLKYFLLGSIASGIILYGISLLYGIYSSLNFFILKNYFLKIYLLDFFFNSNICKISILFIFFGLLFKLGLFPLHFWVPSIYSNSPNIVIFFFSTVIKLVLFIFLLNLFFITFFHFLYSLKLFFIISCIGSMLIGALGAFKELKIKNFISYTSINQIGFLLIGLIFDIFKYICICT